MFAEIIEQRLVRVKPREEYIAQSRQRKASEGHILSPDKSGLLAKTTQLIDGTSTVGISEVNAGRLQSLAEGMMDTLQFGIWSGAEVQHTVGSIRKIIATFDSEIALSKPVLANEQYAATMRKRQEWSRTQTKFRRTMMRAIRP